MASTFTGVFACKDLLIKVDTTGGGTTPNFVVVKDVNTMKPTIKGTVDTWSPYDQGGWQRAMLAGKSMDLAFSGMRNIGDPGNDYIFSLFLLVGRTCETSIQITFPDKSILVLPSVIEVTSAFGGDATKASPLEWTAHNNGAPTYTPAV